MAITLSGTLEDGNLIGSSIVSLLRGTYRAYKAWKGEGERRAKEWWTNLFLAVTWHPRGPHALHPPLLHITY